jgi:hypothetical protein
LFIPFGWWCCLRSHGPRCGSTPPARGDGDCAWRASERQAGRQQDCASQSIEGYPFRIEVRCGGASFELKGTPTLQLKLPRVLAASRSMIRSF